VAAAFLPRALAPTAASRAQRENPPEAFGTT
jgi:hypothetical protein